VYSVGARGEVLHALGKAAVILLIPVLVSLRPGAEIRRRAIFAFLGAMGVTLLISTLLWADVVPGGGLIKGVPGDAEVFKKHITQSTLMAYAAFAVVLVARDAADRRLKILLGALAALAACNVIFMVQGRTGLLILAALLLYSLIRAFRWRGALAAFSTLAATGSVVYLSPGTVIHERIQTTIQQINDWRTGKPATADNMRPESWGNSLEIVRRHPVIGVGTGGFPSAYARQVKGTSMRALEQPENQYLLVAVQLGATGLIALLALFAAQWHFAGLLATRTETELARGLVITFVVGCLFNSFLLDHTEALFYAWISGMLFSGRQPRTEGAAA
jgi:O-antigen ligase